MSLYKEVAKEFNLTPKEVEKVYKSFWLYIIKHIKELPLKGNLLNQKEFENLILNFNIPALGKLGCPYIKYKSIINSYNKHVKNKKHKTTI